MGESSITSLSADADREVSLKDVMLEFKKLATKEDLVQVKSTLVAQSAKIQQLKIDPNNQQERLKVLEDQVGARAAAEANRINRKPDVYVSDWKEYGRAHASSDPNQNKRRNVVIHGLKPIENMEIAEIILDMCQTVGCVIFASDIIDITRLGSYNKPLAKPPPVQLPT